MLIGVKWLFICFYMMRGLASSRLGIIQQQSWLLENEIIVDDMLYRMYIVCSWKVSHYW